MNKAMIESYLRNLLGALLSAITIVMGATGIASPLEFSGAEWLLVANALWASAVPTLLRWVNKKDPAFGMVAKTATDAVTKKLDEAVKEATAKKTADKKPATKKAPAKKKSSGGGSASSNQVL